MKKHRIESVLPGSIAQEAGIKENDLLIAIDGKSVVDILDYRMADAAASLILTIEKPDGTQEDIELEKAEDEFIGLCFEDDLLDDVKHCANKCVFCFVDQLPKGMRKSLNFKDDDWRMSLMMGNYISLTNLSDDEIARIIRLKVSPLYISVHATDPEIRVKMMSNPKAVKLMDVLKRFSAIGIRFHCQIVLCPGLNDGQVLMNTVQALAELYPSCASVAVVPVGLTEHRSGLFELKPLTQENAAECIALVKKLSYEYKKKLKTSFVFASDEMYIKASLPLPGYDSYEEFEQIENGVGLLAKLEYEFDEALSEFNTMSIKREVSIVCGVSAVEFIRKLSDKAMRKFLGLKINVYAVENDFFGHSITVTGLLTGQDIAKHLVSKRIGEELLISTSMLRADTDIFLDDTTMPQLSQALKKPVTAVYPNGWELVEALIKNHQGDNI